MELVARRPVVRAENLAKLRAAGFSPVSWFPLREHRAVVRPSLEIARRALAIAAVHAWAALSEAELSTSALEAHVARSDLGAAMTDAERALLADARGALRASPEDAAALLVAAWTLAWSVGLDPAPALSGAAPEGEALRALQRFVLRGGDVRPGDLLTHGSRADRDLIELEDLFACAHQTTQLARLAHPEARIPTRASPLGIEAARHALTWCLSPGEAWDAVDLTT